MAVSVRPTWFQVMRHPGTCGIPGHATCSIHSSLRPLLVPMLIGEGGVHGVSMVTLRHYVEELRSGTTFRNYIQDLHSSVVS